MAYFRQFWSDLRRVFLERYDLVVIAMVALLAMTLSYYHMLRIPSLGPNWRGALEALGRGGLFLVLPLASAPFLKLGPRDMGLALGRPGQWLRDVLLLYVIMLPLVFFVSRQPDFVRYYPYFRLARLGAGYFLLAQLIQLLFMFCWEFLLRGYLLFGFFRRIGYLAVVIQTIPFVLLHIHKPELEALGSLVAGLVLGVVALRAGSFLPCVLLHFLVAATLDLLSVVRF